METIELTRYGNALKKEIKESHPQMFKTEEELNQFCLQREDKAIKRMKDLVNSGKNHSEAEEVAWKELMEISEQ